MLCEATRFLQPVGQHRHHLEQVAHDSVRGHFEDRRIRVFVDGDDDLGCLHAGEVLYCPGYSTGDIELGAALFLSLYQTRFSPRSSVKEGYPESPGAKLPWEGRWEEPALVNALLKRSKKPRWGEIHSGFMAEGMGFEPMRGVSPPNRLAGGRTKPLCDPS